MHIKSSKTCWDFQEGKCWRGENCKFMHEEFDATSPDEFEPDEVFIESVMDYCTVPGCTREMAVEALKATDHDDIEAMRFLEARAASLDETQEEPTDEASPSQAAAESGGPSQVRQQTVGEEPIGNPCPFVILR